MVNPQHTSGHAESSTTGPGKHSTTGQSDEPTLYEFLTRLVSDPAARSAFDADPQATLGQAGLGGMTATDVLQATSLVLDYAPVEVVAEYDRSLQSSVEKFAASTQHVAINQLHPAHPIEQEELTMLKPTPADYGKDNDVDATLPPAPAPAPAPAPSNKVDVDIEKNYTDSFNLISVHDIASNNDIANGNIVGSIVGSNVTQANETATHVFDTSVDLTSGAASIVHGDVINIVGNSTNVDVLNIANEAPVVGDITANVTHVVGDVTVGDVNAIVANVPVAGNVVGDVTAIVATAPVVGDVVANVASGNITNVGGVVSDATNVVGNVPVVGDVPAGDGPGIPAGDVSALPVEDVTSGLPAGDVSALPVEHATSTLSAPSDLPVVGGGLESVAHTATSAAPLDLGL
ncbi:IniB N-terminal domain-containing protein [Saccharopolyspora sp. ASAGF58]|uniref:IniB N-terminal domain-containing protein n=1 Tax=Saccharopolyspora sp. ASAGF58 TaxID=2719023 RepID=UPI0014465833|nr:IniB N-terminal domain-containing protein [Saccharopolyspora sp. ASAGF58]